MKRLMRPTRWAGSVFAVLGLFGLSAPAAAACSAQDFNGLNVQSQGQSFVEFDAANGYLPITVQLRANKNLPADASYVWTQVSGANPNLPPIPGTEVVLDTTDQSKPTFQTRNFGTSNVTLGFKVTAMCPGNVAVATANGTVTITNVDRPPFVTALATPPIVSPGDLVDMQASGSDSDGDAISYAWSQLEGTTASLTGANTTHATFNAPAGSGGETLKFKVVATSRQLSTTATVTVNVLASSNLPPLAKLTCPAQVNEGEPLLLDGSTSADPEQGPLTYAWSQDNGPPNINLDSEAGSSVQLPSPALGLGMDGFVSFVLRVTDDHNQYQEASCTLQIVDVTKPVLSMPAPEVLNAASSGGTFKSSYDVSAYDNVEGPIGPASIACDPAAPHLFPLGPTTVNCSVSDTAGNVGTGSFLVTVSDLSKPVLPPHNDVAVEATGPDGAAVDYDLPIATDPVDSDVTVACLPPPNSMFAITSTEVTCGAVDDAGNQADPISFQVTVHDTQPPVLTLPAPITAEATSPAGANVSFSASALDVVDLNRTVTCTPPSDSVFPLGPTNVACSASDTRGNSNSGTFTVTVQDTTKPVIDAHADETREATGPEGAVVDYGVIGTSDVVDVDLVARCVPASGTTFTLGDTTVTCNATDASSNVAEATSFVVHVLDTVKPVIDAHADETREATGPNGAVVDYGVVGTFDVVDVNLVASCVPASGSTFGLGQTTVTCNATDASGNVADATSFVVSVVDTTPPVIHYLGDVSVIAGSNSSAVVTYTPTATDIVDGAVAVKCDPASGSTFPMGTSTVACTAVDGHGNKASGSFNVYVSYAWDGFFRPVDMWPVLNTSKAGSAIPLKFNLGGYQGMGIMAPGYPKSAPIGCGSNEDPLTETVTAGQSSLQYDASANQYIYVWKSEKSWAGTCRQIQVKLSDGSIHTANFSFK